jgi:hypothetical protein
MSVATAKVPAAIVSGVICLCLGAGIMFVIQPYIVPADKQAAANSANGDSSGKDGGGPNGGGSKLGMKGGKGGKGGGGAPNSKQQLTQLVTKLDTLTVKPLKFELTADQKKQVKEILADLDNKEAITDEEAKSKLEALLKLLEAQKETLIATGYRWPGEGGGGGGGGGGPGGGAPPPPNPFKEGTNAEHLKSLQESLGK